MDVKKVDSHEVEISGTDKERGLLCDATYHLDGVLKSIKLAYGNEYLTGDHIAETRQALDSDRPKGEAHEGFNVRLPNGSARLLYNAVEGIAADAQKTVSVLGAEASQTLGLLERELGFVTLRSDFEPTMRELYPEQ